MDFSKLENTKKLQPCCAVYKPKVHPKALEGDDPAVWIWNFMEQTGGTVLDLDDATTIGYFGRHLSGEALRWWLDLKPTGTVKTRRELEDAFLESQGPKEAERLAAWKTIARPRPHHYTDWENFQQAFVSQYRVARPLADKEEMIPLFMAILPEEVNEELMKKGDISDFTELSKTAQHYYELNNPKYASTNPVNAYGVPSTAPQPNKATLIPLITAVNARAYPDLSRVLSQLQGQVVALQSQVDRSNSHRGNGGGRGRGNSNRGGHWHGNRQQNGGQNGGGGGSLSDGMKCRVCNGPHFVAECTDPRAEGWRMCQGFYKNRGGSSNRRGRRG